jgi:hypothetical protein
VHWQFYALHNTFVDGLIRNHIGFLFAATYSDSGVFRSTDNGESWQNVGLKNQYGVNGLAMDSTGAILAASHTDYIWRSTDDGNSWTKHDSGLISIGPRCWQIAVQENGFIFGAFYFGGARSSNNGISWTQYTFPPIGGNAYCLGIGNSQTVFMSYLGPSNIKGLYRTTDNGIVWSKIDSTIYAASIISLSHGEILVGTFNERGIFRSTNNGDSWIYSGLDSERVNTIYSFSDEVILAGTDNGIFRSNDFGFTWGKVYPAPTSLQENTSSRVFSYSLSNAPNPFNPTTTIRYQLPVKSEVTITIFDVLGQKVATIMQSEKYPEGTYSFDFDASLLSSGIYFYRLTALPLDDEGLPVHLVKKMAVVK